MKNLNIESFKKTGLSFEDIESVKQGLEDVENGRVYTEQEFYSRIEKNLFANIKVHV